MLALVARKGKHPVVKVTGGMRLSMSETVNSYRTQFPDPDWHEIAERAATETDPKKLALLVKALCDRLYEIRQSKFPEDR